MPFKARTVEVRNIASAWEVRKALGHITRAQMKRYRDGQDFPKPFKTVGRRVELWDLSEVRAWWEQWQARREESE
jgi:predicted DNA-binding transcriptional regulator AlpA